MMSFWKWCPVLVGYSSPKHRWIWYCGVGCPWLRYPRSSARHLLCQGTRGPRSPTARSSRARAGADPVPEGTGVSRGRVQQTPCAQDGRRALTLQELLRVQQLVGLLPLQLVGPVPVRGQWPVPVHPALALALHEDPLGRYPQQHTALQVGQESFQHVGHAGHPATATERPRRGELDLLHAGGAVKALAVGRHGAGGDAAALGRAGGDFLHQHVAVVEADVEPAVWGEGMVSSRAARSGGGHPGHCPASAAPT